ncbi:MAG TPA: hypothetical protein VFS09_11760 [Candidatus Eisenbacteria bacterium]|nr:hypothetical protein [Candidatus Eisenbacteria bacterium]
MLRARATAFVLLLAGSLTACNKDTETGPKASDITGNWSATKVEYVNKAAPGTRVDLIALGGAATMAINADKSFVFVLAESGEPPDTTTGVWKIDGEMFEVTPTGMPFSWMWQASLSGNSLTLTGADMEYDFDGDNVMEQADQNTALVR